MSSVNKVFLMGNVGQAPQIHALQSGGIVARVSLATSSFYTDQHGQRQEITYWHSVIFHNRLAETVKNHVTKGRKLFIDGWLRTRAYDKDGEKRYVTEVIASSLQFVDSKAQATQSVQPSAPVATQPVTQPTDSFEDVPF